MSSLEKGTQKLRKLLANEAKTDEKNLARAQKEVHKAEKSLEKSMREIQKARKQLQTTVNSSHKTAKFLERAQHEHNNASLNLDKAEKDAKEARDKEAQLEQEVSSYRDCLNNAHRNKILNDEDRSRRMSEALTKLNNRPGFSGATAGITSSEPAAASVPS